MSEVKKWESGLYRLDPEATDLHFGEIMTCEDGENAIFTRNNGDLVEKVVAPRRMDGASSIHFNAGLIQYEPSNWCRMECKLLREDAKLPYRKRTTDAGYDVFSVEDIDLMPGRLTSVQTGIALAAPPGFYYTIEGRSGLGMQQIVPFRGIIDSTYTGALFIGLVNHSPNVYRIKKHQRIAQAIVHRQLDMEIVIIDEFTSIYNQRGQAGFGSSGK